MIVKTLGDMDLTAISDHIAQMHPEQKGLPKLLRLKARLHARWHSLKADGSHGQRHRHCGPEVTVRWGSIYATHPEGWFTGQDVQLAGRPL